VNRQFPLEAGIIRVDKSRRIVIPQILCSKLPWITGDHPLPGWLLLGSPARCRLLSTTEVDHADLQALQSRIMAEVSAPSGNALLFQDDESAALALRLIEVQLTPPEPGWRLVLPRHISAIMGLRPGESDIAALFLRGHIELWTIEALKLAVSTPLDQIV